MLGIGGKWEQNWDSGHGNSMPVAPAAGGPSTQDKADCRLPRRLPRSDPGLILHRRASCIFIAFEGAVLDFWAGKEEVNIFL